MHPRQRLDRGCFLSGMKRRLIISASLVILSISAALSLYLLSPEEDPVVRLMTAAGQRETVQLEEALRQEGVDVNSLDWLGRTPLFYAARFGCTANMELLLAQGADANKTDLQGMSPLYAAAWFGHEDCVALLLKVKDINVNGETIGGETAYEAAILNQHTRCAELLEPVQTINPRRAACTTLTEMGIDSEEAYRLYTFRAIQEDDVIMLELLIRAGVVNPHERNKLLDMSPLEFAEEQRSQRCLELLRQIKLPENAE